MLELARTKSVEPDLNGAIALAQKIPASSAVHKEAKAAIATWRKDLTRGQTMVDSIQAAMKARNWGLAIQQLRKLGKQDSDYWIQHVDRLRQKISAEQIAADQLQQARQLVKATPNNVQVLGRAIALAEQINPDTYAYTDSQVDVSKWMQSLFTIVAGKLPPHTDLKGAKVALQGLPRGVPTPNARDVLWFSRAQPLVTDEITRGPLYEQLWHLWMVMSQVRQIKPESPLHAQAKALVPKLETQIQDVTQLQVASALANLWQIPTFHLAINIAHGISADRPRRVYAQTLITMWQRDIERIEDRPYLNQAQQLATKGTPESLRAAITYAQQISNGRPLRIEAQTAIAQWNRQIQLIEDGPFLERAQTLAKQQRLADAIRTASRIRSGRVLYQEAQTAIQDWTYQLQLAEDRPLLDRANALAEQGNLTAAINTASQIAPGRPLSHEAGGAIANWTAQQNARQNPPPAEPDNQIRERRPPDSSVGPPYRSPYPDAPRPVYNSQPPTEPPPPPIHPTRTPYPQTLHRLNHLLARTQKQLRRPLLIYPHPRSGR